MEASMHMRQPLVKTRTLHKNPRNDRHPKNALKQEEIQLRQNHNKQFSNYFEVHHGFGFFGVCHKIEFLGFSCIGESDHPDVPGDDREGVPEAEQGSKRD
eukprot:503730-Amphidinium_carterae.1